LQNAKQSAGNRFVEGIPARQKMNRLMKQATQNDGIQESIGMITREDQRAFCLQ
jgi:hypothetical protein